MFTIEEITLMKLFVDDISNIPNRRTMIKAIESRYEMAEDEEVLSMMKNIVKKLINTTDREYAKIDFMQGYDPEDFED